jgi:IDEAL domain
MNCEVKTMVQYGDVVEYEYGVNKVIRKAFVDEVYETKADVLVFARFNPVLKEWYYLEELSRDLVDIYRLKVVETPIQPHDLNFMIDLALSTRDKQWFNELIQRKRGVCC